MPLSTNGSTTLLLTLDNGLIVSDSSAATTTTVTNAGQNANAFLWGRWIVGEAAALAGKHLLFATDVSSGITHRITASTEWSIQEPANAVGNAFSEVLPRAARGSAYPVNPDAPAVPETVLVPIDLWGNALLHRTVSGRLFANGTELPAITEQGFGR